MEMVALVIVVILVNRFALSYSGATQQSIGFSAMARGWDGFAGNFGFS